jgi:hypothetical protein
MSPRQWLVWNLVCKMLSQYSFCPTPGVIKQPIWLYIRDNSPHVIADLNGNDMDLMSDIRSNRSLTETVKKFGTME